jgi:hypothetical protein
VLVMDGDSVKEKGGRKGVGLQRIFLNMGRRKQLGGKHRHRSMIVWADEDEEDVKRIGPQLEPGEVGQAWGSDEIFEGEKKKGGREQGKAGIENVRCPSLSLNLSPATHHASWPLRALPSSLTIRLPKKNRIFTEALPCPSCSCPFGTHSQLTQHVSQNFDRFDSSVFRG